MKRTAAVTAERCIPLQKMEDIEKRMPGLLAAIAKGNEMITNKGSESFCIEFEVTKGPETVDRYAANRLEEMVLAQIVCEWSYDKNVLVLNPETEKMLSAGSEEDPIVPGYPLNLPYDSFYVRCHELYLNKRRYDGFLVVHGKITSIPYIIITFFEDDMSYWYIPIMYSGSIDESFTDIKRNKLFEQYYYPRCHTPGVRIKEEYHQALRKVLPILQFLHSDEANLKMVSMRSARKKRHITGPVINNNGEVRKWNVSVRQGASIKLCTPEKEAASLPDIQDLAKSPEEEKQEEKRSGSPKRPHTRRAHYHLYWIGKAGTPERRQVVKWVKETHVGKVDPDDNPAVIRTVEIA